MKEVCEILSPGVYRLSDGRKLHITENDVKNACDKGNAMIRAGLRVPGCWEHDLSAYPVYEKNPKWFHAKGYYGDVEKYSLKNGKLFAEINFKDPADLSQFRKVGTVSPRIIYNRIDERGKKWDGLTIAHVASTPTPVQRDQSRIPYDFSATATEAPREGEYDLSGMVRTQMDTKKIITMLQGIIAMLGGDSKDEPDGDELPADTEIQSGANDVGGANNATSPLVMSQLPAGLQIQAKASIEAHRRNMIEDTKKFFTSGRLTRQEAQEHLDRVKTADLSLCNDYSLALTPIVVEHRTLSKLQPKSGWSGKQSKNMDLSQFQDVERPAEVTGEKDDPDAGYKAMCEAKGIKP